MPQSTFASPQIRRSTTPADAPGKDDRGHLGYTLLLVLLLLWLLMNACGLGAQRPSLYPDAQRPSLYPDAQRPSLYPDAQRPSLYPDAQRPSLYPDAQRPSLYPAEQPPSHRAATQHFLNRRQPPPNAAVSPAAALQNARDQHLQLLQQRALQPHTANLTSAWQPLGPNAVVSTTFAALTGRITALAPDLNDPTGNTLYVGTTGGGVWKSTNAAGPSPTIAPLTDTLPVFASGGAAIPSLSIGALAVQAAANPVLLAGTGDPNAATDSLYGEGILRSTDAGLTWSLLQYSRDGANGIHYFLGLSTAAIAFSTATPSLVVAAFTTSPESAQVAANAGYSFPGLYASTDAGLTWQMATLYDGAAVVQRPLPAGATQLSNAATSVVWDSERQSFFAAVRNHGYYASTDGLTWTRLAQQPGTNLTAANCPAVTANTCPIFRGTLAVQPATGDLYALTVDANDIDQGLWQDLCNAASTTCATPAPTFSNRIDNSALEIGSGSTAIAQGTYNLTLAAAPTSSNSTLLFAGTVDLYRCAISSNSSTCTLRNTTNALNGCNAPAAVAPAQHALSAIGQSSGTPILYLGNDGGLWRSLDAVAETGPACSATDASHFTNLNPAFTGSLAEVTSFAQHPTDPNTLLAGVGANGSALTSAASTQTQWPQISAGEGGTPLLDPNAFYAAIGSGINLKSCTLGSACTAANFLPPATIGGPQTSYDTALLDAPTLLDPALTSNLIAGTCRVWRGPAATGTTWSTSNAISPAFDGSTTPCTTASPLIRSLSAGGPSSTSTNAQLSGSRVLYAGIAGATDGGNAKPGHLFVTQNAHTAPATWTDTALPNPSHFDVSSIAVDPHDATGATVYATLMGFSPTGNLFRSTNFGATWTNLSSNLPEAPANAVAIDPNDANTVYVALDTGVYVTQAIATCSTANCWSVLGTALPNAPVTALSAAAQMPTGDGRLGLLRASTYGRGLWQTPLLTAVSTAQPALTLTTNALTFNPQQVSTASTAQTLTLTATGNAPVTFGTPAITGDFTLTTNTCTGSLAVNAQCMIAILFTPTATGLRSGQLTVYANIPTGQATVALSGTGTTAASIVLTPASLTFSATLVNQTTAAQILTVANTGGNPATLQTPTLTGDFHISANTCTATLSPSTACALSITFTPTASGPRTGTLSITDPAGTQTAQLSGTGNANATDTLAPTALTFPQQQIATTSPAQQVTLTNNGDIALTLIAASLPSTDFAVTNACGNSLAAHATCAFSVTFTPTATGSRSAVLSITDQFRTQTVALSGTGTAPPGVSVIPTAVTFPATGVGLSSPAQTLTLTNNGGQTLSTPTFALSPGFNIAATTCTVALAVNSYCTVTIVFTPTAAGPTAGKLTVADNAPTSPQLTTLSGIGIDFTLTPTGATTATLSSGTTATYPLLANSLTGLSGTIALTCTGAPANSLCTVTPATAALGTATPVTVTVQTGVHAQLELPLFGSHLIAFALLLPLAFHLRRRKLVPPLCLLLLLLSGCGAGRVNPDVIPTPTPTPTPSGTYNLTITATAAGLTHTAGLTLIVQ